MAKLKPRYRYDPSKPLFSDDELAEFHTEGLDSQPEEPGLLREAGDTALSVGKGALGMAESVTNLAGADNAASQGLRRGREYLGSLESEQQQEQRKLHAQRMAEAEATGSTWEEVKAAGRNFLDDPLDYAAEGAGSLVGFGPIGLISKGAKVAGLGARTVASTGLGAASGVGSVKGQQYEMVKQARLAEGATPEEAEADAIDAQSYSGDNAIDLLTGGVLGAAAGGTGAERIMLGAGNMAGKGLVKRVATGVLTETPFEALQGGQERYAGNQALIREGYDVDPWQGVAGQAATEGLMSAPVGGAMGAVQGYTPTQDEIAAEQQRVEQQAAAEQAALVEAQRQAEEQRAAEQAKAERDQTRAYYAEQLPFEEFKKRRVAEIVEENVTPEHVESAYQQALGEAVANEVAPPSREKFEKDYKSRIGKEVAKDTEALTQEYYSALDNLAATDVDLLGDPTELKPEPAPVEEPAPTTSAPPRPKPDRRQMDFLGELDRTVQPDYAPVMPVATPGEGTPQTTVFTQTPVDDSGLPGALDEAKRRAQAGGVVDAPPNAPYRNPIVTVRETAMQHGVTPGAWGNFVTKYSLKGAEPETIAEALRDRAINGAAGKTEAWEQAHKALTGITISEYLDQEEKNGDLQTAPDGQNADAQEGRVGGEGNAETRTLGVTQGTQAGGGQTLPVVRQEGQVANFKPESLSAGQQAVYDTLMTAVNDNSFDRFQQSDGTLNLTALASAAGLSGKQAAYAAVKQTVDKVAKQLGTTPEGMRGFLQQRAKAVRTTEASDSDQLGTSPANFTRTSLQPGAQLDNTELFGDDAGATAGFGEISTVGGSQSAVGENVQPTQTDLDRPDPVAEKRAAEAMARYTALQSQALAQPEAAEAASDWDDMRSDHAPFAKDLSRQDAYDWLMSYMEWKHGDITEDQLAAEQLDIERRYDANPAKAALGREGARADGQAEPRTLAEGTPAAGETADVQAQGGETQGGETEDLIGLLSQLRSLAKEPKHAALAKDYLARAGRGEDVESEAGQWVNSVLEDRRGVTRFSLTNDATGQPADEMRSRLRKLFVNPALFDRRVTVVQSEADVPGRFTASKPSGVGSKRLGFYDPKTGHVWMIADNIRPGREFSVFMHEVGGHMGMMNLLGKANYDTLVKQIKEWAQGEGSLENQIAAAAWLRVSDAQTALGRQLSQAVSDDELIAYFVEEAVVAGVNPTALASAPKVMQQWFLRLWNAVKAAVRKLGIDPATLTATDVVDLAYGAARLQLSGSQTDIDAANLVTGRPATEPVYADIATEPLNSISSRATPTGAFAKAGEMIDAFMVDPKTKLDALKLGWMTLEQMADRTKLTSLRNYIGTVHKMQASAKDRVAEAAAIDIEWAKLDDADAAKLGDVMVRSTLAEYDPTTTAPANSEQIKLRADLAAVPGGQALYEQVRDFFKSANDEKRAILTAAAKAAGKSAAEVDKLFAQVKGPYFPLMRVGEWYAVTMSDEVNRLTELQEAGEASAADKKRLAELRKNPAHYVTKSFRSRSEAEAFAKQAGMPVSYVNTQKERIAQDVRSLPDFAKFEDYIGTEFDAETRAKLRDMMGEMYYDMLPNSSGLKHQMHREGIHGATFGRSEFARSAMSQAHLVSRLKFADELGESMVAVDKDARRGGVEARQVYNELQKRNALAMDNAAPPAWVDLALKGSYFAHLGVSPAYWLTNATQVPMITLPWLGARHGLASSTQALARAMVDVKGILKSSYAKDGWRFEFDWKDRFPEGSGESELFRQLLERNKLDVTIEHDLMAVADLRHGKLNEAVKFLNTPVRSIELVNRGMTALAAYNLGLKKFGGDQQKAIDHAIKAVNDTQLDYSTLNAARHMQSVLGSKTLARLMMQFRKFQQGMIYLISTSAYDALKGADPDTRREARNTLFGLMATTGLMAGSLGLPAAGTVVMLANLIAAAFDDDDEPFNAENEWRNFIVGAVGHDMGEVLLKGLPSLVNIDASNRVGMGDVLNPVPFFRQGSNGRESASNLLSAVAGAPFGTLADTWDGIDKMANGDFAKGAEKVLPIKLAQNLVRSARYADEGMTDTRGNVVLEDDRFSPWDLAVRAMGFSTAEETTYYEANQAVNDAKYAARDARTRLLRDLVNGDKILASPEVLAFNRRHPGERITAKTIRQSRKTRDGMLKSRTAYGVRNDESNADYLDEAAFAEDDNGELVDRLIAAE